MRSNTGPTHHKVSMLKRMCHREAGWCRNIDVMKVHGRWVASAGIEYACADERVVAAGQAIFNSVSTIQTATHITMIVTVITGSPFASGIAWNVPRRGL